MTTYAHVAVASLNQTVGDWTGNRLRILEVVHKAKQRGVKLLLLPEMAISGYSLGDRLPREGTLARSFRSLKQIASAPELQEGIVLCVGLPIEHRGVIYNAAAVIAHGALQGLAAKENLATGDVEYEDRWFQAWPRGLTERWVSPDGEEVPLGSLIFEAEGLGSFAFEVCEDAWKGLRPGSMYALAGADMILNPSASWFTLGKQEKRRSLVVQNSREDHSVYLYASLLGCDNTRLIFDGSLLIASDGELVAEGERFRFEDSVLLDAVVDLSALRLTRREEGSWRRQVQLTTSPELSAPERVALPGAYRCETSPKPRRPYWLPAEERPFDQSLQWVSQVTALSRPLEARDGVHLELELALSLGLRDYVRKAHISELALALSGGRDSAMVALLVHRMLRYDNPSLSEDELRALMAKRLLTAYMATENSGGSTRAAAQAVADELGARFYDMNIQGCLEAHHALVQETIGRELSWSDPVDDIALQNVQARLRGGLIWFLANLRRALLLSTSNKSEAAVGYATMDGDTSGGLSPIADVPKSLVSLWLAWAEELHGYKSLRLINGLQPSAELRPSERAQTDEDDLMPFEVLDQLIYGFAQLAQDPLELFISLWPTFKGRYKGDPKAFGAHIHTFVRLFCFAQWKRERFAVSFRVSVFDLDPKGGGRYPVIQAPFTEELAELDEHIEHMVRGAD